VSRILIVEDDARTQRLLQAHLTARGYDVQVVASGSDALALLAEEEPDLVLLDIALPGMDGLEVCRQLREWSSVPILFLTATDTPRTKIEALDRGGDDFLTKPFHMGELLARIRAVLRRSSPAPAPPSGILTEGELTLDLARREVRQGTQEISLTRTEFDLLRELVTHAGKVLTYDYLLQTVWGPGYDDVRLVQVHVGNLRRKLERGGSGPRTLRAVHGIGYRFQPDE
jgi:two-component system KDP operon response regulator KdpE